jgi:hypothetical protein
MKKILIFATLASLAVVIAFYLVVERDISDDLYLPI